MRKIFGIGFFVMLVSPDLTQAQLPVGDALSRARTIDGHYISWKEHLIDGLELTGVEELYVCQCRPGDTQHCKSG